VSGNETSPAAGCFSTAATTVEVVSTAELVLFLTPAGGRPGFLGYEGLLFPPEKDRNDVFSIIRKNNHSSITTWIRTV
jgi:hypothetical protein